MDNPTSTQPAAQPSKNHPASERELATLRSLLADIRSGVQAVKDAADGWKDRADSTSDLDYSSGISLLSLKNHVLVSYLQHLVALFSLKLAGRSLTDTDGPADVVAHLVKLRVVLEKIVPLEQRLKYQVEKLVRKADQFDEEGAQNEEDVLNDPLAFRPNPANLVLDRTQSEEEDEEEAEERAGVYRPPRLAAMPYVEAPAKGKRTKRDQSLPSHLISDISHTLSSSTPYAEATSGLSVSHDPSLQSGTARHLKRLEQYEMDHFTRKHMSKKESKKRRAQEEEVAFGGLGAGAGGKRRLGGFGAEFDDLLGAGRGGEQRREKAYDAMRGMKRPKVARGGERDLDSRGTSGVSGDGGPPKRSKFDKAVKRSNRR
ncbi:small subunit rRNA maturation protein LCP5 [Rhodotorula paludigena]|uniref:small subunit rRNA maturation protein LCP5 n=1 Tax=Rhodotorula paludigena TaxID=86838 RepID=UPI00317111C6